jgi:TetR/AcrR family transcriptional regulator, transcriptional repressor for nem operon
MMLQKKGQETRSHILKESRRLFTLQGFQNTSISEIIAATDVKKGNLYYHFPSKEELGLAVLIDARDEFFTILENSLTGEQAVERILHSCNSIMAMMQQTNFVGGCLFGNTALEMTDSSSRFGKIIREVFSHWITLIEQELRLMPSSENQNNTFSPKTLATVIVATLEGGIMLSRVYQDKQSLEACITAIQRLITQS